MSAELERYRQASIELVLRKAGRSTKNSFLKLGQLTQSDYQGLIAKLPHADSNPMQVMTPGANYGKFYFIPDYSTVDGGDIIP
jgi:hypothetical protein